jgi:RNA polymerase sigma factor (TIGR02999 family)
MAIGSADLDRLMPELYAELKKLAVHALGGSGGSATLQPTAVVHEAYLRLRRAHDLDLSNRKQFLALAGKVMRQVLIDYARGRSRAKRGGGVETVVLDEEIAGAGGRPLDLLALDAALSELSRLDPRQVEIVELRFLAGLTVQETAEALELSATTVKREAAMARAFLVAHLGGSVPP